MDEVLSYYRTKIDSSDILRTLKLKKQEYFLVSVHREENLDSPENVIKFKEILNQLGETYNYPIIVSTHPRTRKMFTNLGLEFHPLVDRQR